MAAKFVAQGVKESASYQNLTSVCAPKKSEEQKSSKWQKSLRLREGEMIKKYWNNQELISKVLST